MISTPLCHSQLGFRPGSLKLLTFVPPSGAQGLPERIPFYLHGYFDRIPRDRRPPEAWKGNFFPWPFDLGVGRLRPAEARIAFSGELVRRDSRWGTFWQGDFSGYTGTGNVQIETDYGCTYPIAIHEDVYVRLQRSFLNYLYCQRSGLEIPGIRRAEHLDDAVRDDTGEQVPMAGGWYDAGDLRKWMFLTQPNLDGLAAIAERGHPGLRDTALDEIRWGNRFYHAMVAPDGQVWEDVAGGTFRAGLDPVRDWWYENHPGCNCDNSGGVYTDNRPGTGDERPVRTSYNPAVQYMFVRTQCHVTTLLPGAEGEACRAIARKAWAYGQKRGHERRTLFVAEELWAALDLRRSGALDVPWADIAALADELMARQDDGTEGLHGYFMERDASDGFRCIALSCEPALALLRLVELNLPALAAQTARAKQAVTRYIDGYVLADARSNPFGIGPYGVYFHPTMPEHQTFRDAGRGRGVRTFIHPFGPQQIVHGTSGVVTHQAALCAKAGALLQRPEWSRAAETMLQWVFGHNPQGLSLHRGVGFVHPTPFSVYVTQLPDTVCVGHIGRPDDTPYLETSPLVEWCTQEIWDIPNSHLTAASLWL